ncbi:MAG: peptidoglycan DD-metalloendopeptidase family protein [Bacteroides sp.]
MKRLLVILLGFCWLVAPLAAQSNRLIKELERKRGSLQQQIVETESLLKNTKKDVGSQLNGLAALTSQIEERKRYINAMTADVEAIQNEVGNLQRQLNGLRWDLKDKKKKYESSVQYLYKNKTVEEKLLFVLSAQNLGQTYRRLRYVREYATYQRMQGEEIVKKQALVEQKKRELEQVRYAKEALLHDRESEKTKLEAQEKDQRVMVAGLQKKQKGLQREIGKKKREANQLNARIDQLIAQEIERARKRAEEEARQAAKREAEARRKAEEQARAARAAKAREEARKNNRKAVVEEVSEERSDERIKAAPVESFNVSNADRALSRTFINNRGRLPMPVSGPCLITSHYGSYAVEGLRNVKLDNKGIDIQGKPGAQARAIFDGKVAAVFQLNGLFNVLVRHGSYISVYCNLASATVKAGDTVHTKQSLGSIFSDRDDGGRTVLHFQLRHEKEKLNPESWLSR